eukprot:TRINITY_DN355_c0_g1::TRINITY_DN355_c0_g1_i1::g.7445::m.7445 TRINITY_DN355_c0_g1::TRINITY_DN355_c0_g1_i1::g.7445  ORF type:complete len:171 (-),score=14.27,sp/O80800/ACPM2_ARATH/46.99/7e-19,PP-binding/PF00550.20/6.2e-08,PP-binding_2/PF14573.1/0.0017,DUF1493/PF07377.7/0.0098 TRINITY_DN355_c0_g1_i1:201-668(-)
MARALRLLRSSAALTRRISTPLIHQLSTFKFAQPSSFTQPCRLISTTFPHLSGGHHHHHPDEENFERGEGEVYLDPDEVAQRIMVVVRNFDKVDPAKVTRSSHFIKDLGLDSLDTVELFMCFEDEFEVRFDDETCEGIHTIEDVVKFVSEHPFAQ